MKRTAAEIERDANRFLEHALDTLFQITPLTLRPYSLHNLKEKGIDFMFETEFRPPNSKREAEGTEESEGSQSEPTFTLFGSFYVQNKGVDKAPTILKSGDHIGTISHQLEDTRQLRYFGDEVDHPLVITLCDLETRTIYWNPIQLNYPLYSDQIKIVEQEYRQMKRKTKSIQIYFDPTNVLFHNNEAAFKNFSRLLTDIKSSREYLYEKFKRTKRRQHNSTRSADPASSAPFIDQLHQFAKSIYKELNFVPVHQLSRQLSLLSENGDYSYYSNFTLFRIGAALSDFFNSLKIESNAEISFKNESIVEGVDGAHEKAAFILNCLNGNLITQVEDRASRKKISIHLKAVGNCGCLSCTLSRFDFASVFQKLHDSPNEMPDRFKLAYSHYELRNYIKSAELFLELADLAKRRGLFLYYFIASYNSVKLINFIRSQYFGKDEPKALLSSLSQVNLDEIYSQLHDHDQKEVIHWIYTQAFYSDAIHTITQKVEQIKVRYHSQLNGGWSSEDHVQELYNEFAQLETFLSRNYIVYDRYDKFTNLVHIFVEGLFASHAMRSDQPGRLKTLNKYMFQTVIKYGKAEKIKELFLRYKLKHIAYERQENGSCYPAQLLVGFLDQKELVNNEFESINHGKSLYFWEYYNQIFANLMTLVGMMDLTADEVNSAYSSLAKFMSGEIPVRPFHVNVITDFIRKQSGKQDNAVFIELLLVTITSKEISRTGLLDEIFYELNRSADKPISLQESDVIQIQSFLNTVGDNFHRNNSVDFLPYLHLVFANQSLKDRTKTLIHEILSVYFTSSLFSISAAFDVLEYESGYMDKLKGQAREAIKVPSMKKLFSGIDDRRYPILNQYINLCFKYNLDTTDEAFAEFRNLDPYYDWLLDMNNFNYELFDPQWINEYRTKFYLERIKLQLIVKEKLREYLSLNKDEKLAKLYFEWFLD